MDRAAFEAFQCDPYPHYARARRAGGLTFSPELEAWLVARDADAREVLRRPEEFSSANALRPEVALPGDVLAELGNGIGGGPTVISSDGEQHRRLRVPHNRGLSRQRVEELAPFVDERASDLVRRAAGGGAEWMRDYARVLPAEVLGRLVGLGPRDVPTVFHGIRRAEELLFRPLGHEEQLRAAREVAALQHLLDSYVRDRWEHPRADVCTEFVRALVPGDEGLSRQRRGEVVSSVQNFLLAGYLTTTALLGSSVLHLLADRRQWETLRRRPGLVPNTAAEAARFDPPLQGFRRLTTAPVTLSGVKLPPGSVVFVAFGSANRDGAAHERPDVLDVTRRVRPNLAFGHGPHACPGILLARQQVQATLRALLREIPEVRIARGAEVGMEPTLIHRSPVELPLTWT
ncbi:hypothetical protein FHX37_0032 [Haloactinospora alba]|uniref:Cytochrome P450 n=1 Tax=Haloactinospora alba TaxID=405555 RepID=A0A543NEA2_9ACTN|nr:cytochrome P450 [Haloactinospora alba]TQN30171.1 hypothetical protein FHX37_0032 [Haloactinospora alba]